MPSKLEQKLADAEALVAEVRKEIATSSTKVKPKSGQIWEFKNGERRLVVHCADARWRAYNGHLNKSDSGYIAEDLLVVREGHLVK